MGAAFVDSSVIVSLGLNESAAPDVRERMAQFDAVYASPLLEAEYASACRRENIVPDTRLLDLLEWVMVRCSLRPEIGRTLSAGYVRGAECHHLATALYLARDAGELTFLRNDARQEAVARALGFQV